MTTPRPPALPAGSPQNDQASASGAGTPATEAGSGRSGYLYRKVALHLADHPDTILKVGEITRAIGAPSSGAVFEALKKMAAAGHATHHRDPHHRFQITQAGIDAAGTLPPAAPRTRSSGSAGGGRQARPAPVPRPNGTLYHPRRLGKGWDVEELRRLRTQQVPMLLYGPPGTGKTAMVEAAFPDLLTVAGTGDTVVDDFLGSYNPMPGGGYEFVHGPLVTAMREGRVLLVDDATLIPPRVLAVLYPAMDGRGMITIPSHGNETVQAADGFYIVAGHNPGVHGAVLTEALASRFTVHLHVTTDWDLARQLGVPKPVVAAAIDLNADLAAGKTVWAPQLRELLGFVKVRDHLGMTAALANLAGIAPEDARDDVTAALSRHTGTPITALALGKR
ncbi:AAA family ATPase [Micromonospora krabiensis]|uniref:AAA domain (Dynein-related subfamily) n=1 Tax=Micromonospora krabiensis TaxID=307121 RepID=A0A1C3N6W4_9ACTN|nr:AAA family ATPase [Micromonospora krabiensis]SBV28283.1 AAA domain (dynein-related subfamily) [Micromonospora krabiensis]